MNLGVESDDLMERVRYIEIRIFGLEIINRREDSRRQFLKKGVIIEIRREVAQSGLKQRLASNKIPEDEKTYSNVNQLMNGGLNEARRVQRANCRESLQTFADSVNLFL